MSAIVKFIWGSSSRWLRLNLALKAAISVLTSLIDILALILFAQLLSSLVRSDIGFLLKISQVLGFKEKNLSFERVYLISIVIIILLVLIKSFLILTVNRKILKTLSLAYEKKAEEISKDFFSMQVIDIKAQPSYETFLAINSGVRDILIIGTSSLINILTEIVVVTLVFSILVFHGGISSLVLAFYFIITFFIINRFSGATSKVNAQILTESNLSAAITIQAIVESYREIRVFNSLDWFLARHQSAVTKTSDASVNLQFTVFIPKIILESTFVIGIALFTWYKIAGGDIEGAIVEVGFLVAMGSRIIPSLLRLQFSLYQFKQIIGSSSFTMKLLNSDTFRAVVTRKLSGHRVTLPESTFSSEIVVHGASFKYPGADTEAVSDVSLRVKSGERIGIVGRTGSGKSTLIDLLLGVIDPNVGRIEISGLEPKEAFTQWPGKIGFVPQNISVVDGSIRSNILLGRSSNSFSDDDFRRALDFAGLSSYIDSLEFGLETVISRAGSELSGGQRQKLGISRAVISRPEILILDEVTSSLDAESESVVVDAISNLGDEVTLVVVAHRLTTIRSMDRIILLENGRISAFGKYEELAISNQTFRTFIELSEL